MSKDNQDHHAFLERMHQEKLEAQKRRAEFNIRKFLFVGSLFTLGAAKLPKEIDLTLVLYIVPFISICFDLFVLGEDYGIKRIGGFIKTHSATSMDSKWETWVGARRDPFATYAVPLLTLLVLTACVVILWPSEHKKALFWVWLTLNGAAPITLLAYSQWLRAQLLTSNDDPNSSQQEQSSEGMVPDAQQDTLTV